MRKNDTLRTHFCLTGGSLLMNDEAMYHMMNDEAMYHIGAMVGTALRYAGIRVAQAHLNKAGDQEKDVVLADSCPTMLQEKVQ